MTEQSLIDLLERAADRVPDSRPPVETMVYHAQVRRRRMRRTVAGCVAAVVAVGGIGAGIAATRGHTGAVDIVVTPAAGSLPAPPAGTRWMGVGRTVVAVPVGWTLSPADVCQQTGPRSTVVSVVGPSFGETMCADYPAPRHGYGLIALMTSRAPLAGSRRFVCHGAQCSAALTSAGLGVVYVAIRGDARRVWRTLANSVTTLPEGWVSVPLVDARGDVLPNTVGSARAARTVRSAGLVPRVVGSRSTEGDASRVSPPIGTPVRVGSVVTIR